MSELMEQSGKWVDATSVKTFRWLPEHRSENIILYDNQPWEPQMDRLIQIEA